MKYPCDIPEIDYDSQGREIKLFHCPYADTYMGYEDEMCRNCCGLGVDEDSYPYEEHDYEENN